MTTRHLSWYKSIGTTLLLGGVVLLLYACGPSENIFSNAYCRFFYDNTRHNDPTLATAMTLHGGAFVTVSASGQQFDFTSNQGLKSHSLMTAAEVQRGYVLGLNGGIIVGYGFSIDNQFYAYDRECPNCYVPNQFPRQSHKVLVNEFGIGTCSNCHRQYDLNNGGIISKGAQGKKMFRYRATTTGPYGVLNVY